jgi:hypothetical protein
VLIQHQDITIQTRFDLTANHISSSATDISVHH